MVFGVYVGNKRNRGKLVYKSTTLRRAVEVAESKTKWLWVWVKAV